MKPRLATLKRAVYKSLLLVVCVLFYAGTATFGQEVTTNLYFTDSARLTRIDPVAAAIPTTVQSVSLSPTAKYLYAFRGSSKIDFWRYDVAANAWVAMATTPGTVSRGGALTTDGTYIYAIRGAATDFWRYNTGTNSWASMASLPAAAYGGASLVYLNGAIYAVKGSSSTTFWKYNIATNSWTTLATTPSPIDWGGSLTTDGTNIYATKGLSTTTFWKYSVSTNTWSALASTPGAISAGGSISFDGSSIVALQGGNQNNYYKYDIAANAWSTLAPVPSPVFKGGSLVSDGQNSYALKGNAAVNLWKNNGTAWSSLTNAPALVDSGGAMTKFGYLPSTTTFSQSNSLCSDLTIKAGTVTVSSYISINYGIMPASPDINVTLKSGWGDIITLTNPVYDNATGLLTWTGTLGADAYVPASEILALDISSNQQGVSFKVLYGSQAKPSKVSFQTSSFVSIGSMDVYNAPYPAGSVVANVIAGYSRYIRASVSSPFGFEDVTGLDITITPPGTTLIPTIVDSSACSRIYESNWIVPASGPDFTIDAAAKQGLNQLVTDTRSISISICTTCPPDANIDYATGNGGEPLEIDVLANDSDPNNDIDSTTLTVVGQPNNGNVVIDNNKITYLPNGTFDGNDTLTYEICDQSAGGALCSQAQVIITVLPIAYNTCADAGTPKTYYMPFAEDEAFITLQRSGSPAIPSNDVRTIISIKVSYPGMKLVWDHWEDGYETDILNPIQATTQVWGDSNIYNGIAPGYPNDILTPGASIVLDNTMPTPRVAANIFFDGKDKLYSTGQISVTQVCGEPSIIAVQCMKTNVSAYPSEYGKSFTLPVGQDIPSQDFVYSSLLIRAAQNNTTVQVDRDNNGTFDVTLTLNEGQVVLVDEYTAPAGIKINSGAMVASNKPIGVDAHFGGIDNYSCREVPVFPATWYSYTYYTPVPTTGPAAANPADTAVVMLYNSLNRDLNINWTSGIPSSGTILLKANSWYRFPMPMTAAGAFKFTNPTQESFVALEIYDSYTPGGGGNSGSTRDWAFNLISEARLTDFASIAWAPGSTDGTRNDNPIWVTPNANTTIYVKYDGNILSGPNTSPCGLKYDAAIPLNQLNYTKIKNPTKNDQSGTAIYTCNGAKIAAVYGEDAATARTANPSWDVGSTIQPFCKEKMIIANDDYAVTLVNTPVTIRILRNDVGFLAVINPASVTTTGLLQPSHGTVKINPSGTVVYIPDPWYVGKDTFEYNVCSTPFPIVCGTAKVYVTINSCPSPQGQNFITGQVFLDKDGNGLNDDDSTGYNPAKVYLYVDGDCSNTINPNGLIDSADVDMNGYYQFIKSPEKMTADDFDLPAGGNSCASGSDGSAAWKSDWYDSGDPSGGFCVTPAQTAANTDVEIVQDGSFGYALRMDDKNNQAIREFNIQSATQAYLSFSYRVAVSTLAVGENIFVQLSSNGSSYNTVYTIAGSNTLNANYIDVSNIPINVATYGSSNKAYLRFITNNNVDEGDYVFIDSVEIKFLQYNQCYIISINNSALPANAVLTTSASKQVSFANAGVCAANVDFGIKRILTYAVSDENSTWQNMAVSGPVKQNDFDQESNTQTFTTFLNPTSLATLASGSTVSGTAKNGAPVANAGTLTYNAGGNYTFTPVASFTGTLNIPYKICDNGSPSACDTAYLMITVDPLPASGNSVIANNDEDISYGEVISDNLLFNDQDPKDYSFTVTLFKYDPDGDGIPNVTTMPGTPVTVGGIDITGHHVTNAGTILVESDGTYTFTPTEGFVGRVRASYTITNAVSAVAIANLRIDVLSDINGLQNDPPFAGDDFAYTTVDQPISNYFIINDRDHSLDTMTMNGSRLDMYGSMDLIGAPVATTKGGTIKFYTNGIYEYTPPAGYVGPDLVTYTICDISSDEPQPLCANAIVHFLVGPGINISGKVWNDANGDVIQQAATEPVTNVGGLLYVNLINELGYVIGSVPVAANGTYSFNNASPGKNYSLVLSTTQGTLGDLAPTPSLPEGWINTGETRNGTIDYGEMGIIDDRTYGYTSVVNYDFGIERTPTSVPFYVSIPTPTVGQQLTLNGGSNPPILSGKDGEDCPSGCTLNGRNLSIDIPPLNSNLYYAGILVTPGQVITNFDPNQLKVEFTAVTVASMVTNFYYSFIDAAGKKDSVPAIYSLNWLSILPAKGLALTANRSGDMVTLNWKTISEMNSDYFEVERSTDAKNYSKVGVQVKAAGNSSDEKHYQLSDDVSNVLATTVYYRIKLTDINGSIAYSNVAIVNLPSSETIKVSPNPFLSNITISMPVEQNTSVSIRMLDISGRAVLNTTKVVSKDLPQVTLSNLNGLLKGIYVIEVIDLQTGKKTVTKLEKSNQ